MRNESTSDRRARRGARMVASAGRKHDAPRLAPGIAIVLGSFAVAQLAALTALLLFGASIPRGQAVLAELSVIDWVALYGLQGLLAYSMWCLARRRKRAVTWFTTYVGLSAWGALAYSLLPYEKPHFDELASLSGLLVVLGVLAYLRKLKRDGFLC